MRLEWQLFNLGRSTEAALLDKMWALLQPLCGDQLHTPCTLQARFACYDWQMHLLSLLPAPFASWQENHQRIWQHNHQRGQTEAARWMWEKAITDIEVSAA